MSILGFFQDMIGMGDMTEQVIATDLLLASKSGVINYAMTISEAVTPEVRDVLRRHLDVAIETHEKVAAYMMKNGYYHVTNPQEQIRVDMQASDTVLDIHRP
ncbi:spore coat protein [Desulfosporosinus nitroreducens]|nr:spore coat protein [Desulfosporosinus nitroreducens]MCO1603720.1 spore coat protein [Desulfosporosinus nitroreducens]